MPALTTTELAQLREFPQHVERYLSIAPRVVVFSAQITQPVLYDNESGNYYGLRYTAPSGNPSDARTNMTIFVGTAIGLDDIGRVRLRGPINTAEQIVPISETPYGDLPLTATCFLTIYELYEPANRLIRLVGTKTGNSQFINDFIEYHDYDQVYTNQNTAIQPIVNIYTSIVNGNFYAFPRLADFALPNTNYRELNLYADAISIGSAPVTSVQWDVRDCTVVAGSPSTFYVRLRVPVGFRYVSVTVSNGSNSTTRYIPLWTHGGTYQPLGDNRLGFKVENDETEKGRNMTFTIFGNQIDQTQLPTGTLVCYWERESPVSIPSYRSQFHGWVHSMTTDTKEYGEIRIEVGGISKWMELISGFGTQLNHNLNPRKWFEMPNITLDKFIHYLLREYSTVMSLCNFYPSNDTRVTNAETAARASLWEQCSTVCAAYEMRRFLADSNNSLHIISYLSYQPNGTFNFPNERNPETTMTIVADDLTADDPLQLNEEVFKPIGRTDSTGNVWPLGAPEPTVVASRAPSKSSGQGSGSDDLPFQRLRGAGEIVAQNYLNWLVGQHYALKNSRLQDVSITFVGNYDVFEPARYEQVYLNYNIADVPTLTGENIQKWFIVKKVSVKHSNERGNRRKTIQLTLEEVTSGVPGVTVPIPKGQWVDNPMWDFFWKVNPAMPYVYRSSDRPHIEYLDDVAVGFALVLDRINKGAIGRTFSFHTNYPIWERIDADLGHPANVDWHSLDAFLEGEALRVRVAGSSPTEAVIAYCPDALAETPTWIIEDQFLHQANNLQRMMTLRTNAQGDLWVLAYAGENGTRVRRSIGNGTWGAIEVVGSTTFKLQPAVQELGLDVHEQTIVTSAKDALNDWRVYTSTGVSGPWTVLNLSPGRNEPYNTLKIASNNKVYCANYIGSAWYTTRHNEPLVGTVTSTDRISGSLTKYTPSPPYYDINAINDLAGTSLTTEHVLSTFDQPKVVRMNVPWPSIGDFFVPYVMTPSFGTQVCTPWRIRYFVEIQTSIQTHTWEWETEAASWWWITFSVSTYPYTRIFRDNITVVTGTAPPTFIEYLDINGVAIPFNITYIRTHAVFVDNPSQFPITSTPNGLQLYQLIGASVPNVSYRDLNNALGVYYRDETLRTPPLNVYIDLFRKEGGFIPHSRGAIALDDRYPSQYMAINGDRMGKWEIEHRLNEGSDVNRVKEFFTPDLTGSLGIKWIDPLIVVYGENLLTASWRDGVFEDKRGNWVYVAPSTAVPMFRDLVMLT